MPGIVNIRLKKRRPKRLVRSPWSCRCGAHGIMIIGSREDPGTWAQRMIDLHRLSSPYCQEKEIGIGPLPCSENELMDEYFPHTQKETA